MVGDPVGIMMDTSQFGGKTAEDYLASQPELVTNGDGSSATGWDGARSNETVTSTGGRIRATATAAGAYGAVQTLSGLTVGEWYVTSAEVFTAGGSGTFYFRLTANSDLTGTTPVEKTRTTDFAPNLFFQASATTMYVGVINVAAAGGDYAELDNISVIALSLIHISEPTRPY